MIKVESAIRELLFDCDCVIVPGLGGILGNYTGAEVHPVTNALRPPRKKIAFNEELIINDALLQNYIARVNNLSTDSALGEIQDFVKSFNKTIRREGLFRIDGVGDFIRNEENKIQFQPIEGINFLDKSFGLTELYYKPVQREIDETMKQIDNQTPPMRKAPIKNKRSSQIKSENTGEHKKGNSFLYFLIPGLFLLLGGGTYVYLGQKGQPLQEASLVSTDTLVEEKLVDELADVEVEDLELFNSSEEDGFEAEEEIVEHADEAQQYYIVAGVFSTEENARKFTVLYNNGEILSDGQYFRVYLDKFDSKAEAVGQIEEYRENFGEKLWVLEY
jgi:hypothetical protein